MGIADVIRLHARLRPTRDAIVEGSRRISYASFDRRINCFCNALFRRGIRRGDFIGVALADSAEQLIALLGLARIGAVIVPIDHRWHAAEQLSVATQFRVRHVLCENASAVSEPWLCIRSDWFDETADVYRDPQVTADSPLLLSLSSGTTGRPKGPCTTHQKFENRFMPYWINVGLNANDRYVCATPLYFGAGRGFAWGMLFAGATVHLFPPPYEPHELIEYVNEVRATATFLVPTIIRRLLEIEAGEPALPTMKRLISSGSALFAEERRLIRRRLTPNLYEMYSSTEGGAVSVLGPDDVETHEDSVGRPCFRVDIEIVDENHKPLPNGETGRLRYRSPASAQSYFGDEGSEAFRDGWYYPGDLASLGADGFVYLRGRVKDMIIRGGVNIFPGDIEQVLMASGKVSEAAVVGIPSHEYGEEVVAAVVPSQKTDVNELIMICKSRLAPYKVPKAVVILDALPKNGLGKVVKSDLIKSLTRST